MRKLPRVVPASAKMRLGQVGPGMEENQRSQMVNCVARVCSAGMAPADVVSAGKWRMTWLMLRPSVAGLKTDWYLSKASATKPFITGADRLPPSWRFTSAKSWEGSKSALSPRLLPSRLGSAPSVNGTAGLPGRAWLPCAGSAKYCRAACTPSNPAMRWSSAPSRWSKARFSSMSTTTC